MPVSVLLAIAAVILVLAILGTAVVIVFFLRATRGASGLRARILALFSRASHAAPTAPASHYYRPYWAKR